MSHTLVPRRQPDSAAEFDRLIGRREALIAAGLGAGAVLLGRGGASALAANSQIATIASACTLSPEVTQGPYYIANHLTRRDIRENRPGLLLNLTLTVIGGSCRAIKGADVEIWHADAGGLYSGFGSSPSAPTGIGVLRHRGDRPARRPTVRLKRTRPCVR